MNSKLLSRLSLIAATMLMLVLSSCVQAVPKPSFMDILDGACASATALTKAAACQSKLEKDLKDSFDPEGKITDVAYCCAVTSLRSCVLAQIGDNCGKDAQESAGKIANRIVKATKLITGNLPCEGNEIYFEPYSPLCWPIEGFAAALILVLFIFCCCFLGCCCSCMKERRRGAFRHPTPRHRRRSPDEYIPRI